VTLPPGLAGWSGDHRSFDGHDDQPVDPFLPALLAWSRSRSSPGCCRVAAPERRVHHACGQKRGAVLLQALRGPSGFLFLLSFLLTFALANMEAVLALYGQKMFSMGPMQVGLLMGAMGIVVVIQQGVVIGPLTRKIGEPRVIQLGLVVGILGFVSLALAPTLVLYGIAAIVFNAGSALLQPSVTSLISQRAVTGQGATMGLNQSFQSLGRATGPLWAGFAFDLQASLAFWTGALISHRADGVGARAAAAGVGHARDARDPARFANGEGVKPGCRRLLAYGLKCFSM
jgi:hypothetical protein